MNQEHPGITIKARWDQSQVPTGEEAQRGLLLEIEAIKPVIERSNERPPVNVALVIDRSGSMQGEPIHAAIEAAVGVAEQLRDGDRLSVVCYDNQIDVLVDGERMSTTGRKRAELAIRALSARGMTNLADGWLQGARCVANVMERHGFESGHVILLSDGCANEGECDPEKLSELASGLAERSVTTTCVGIGAHYSLLQLTAIAEYGQGELHQSSEPSEIIEVILGELGEQTAIVARNFSIHLEGLDRGGVRQLTRYRLMPVNGRQEYFIGNLVAGQSRRVAFLVDIPPVAENTTQNYKAIATWLDPETGLEECRTGETFRLHFVSPQQFDRSERDREVAEIIAEIWMARTGYDAMMYNEHGRFDEAVDRFDSEEAVFRCMVEGLDREDEFLASRSRVRESTSRRWDGLSKKESMLLARKRMRSKPDFRPQHSEQDWTDYRNE